MEIILIIAGLILGTVLSKMIGNSKEAKVVKVVIMIVIAFLVLWNECFLH